MGLLKKLSGYILPKEVDFFGNLEAQSKISENIVAELYEMYVAKTGQDENIRKLINAAKQMRTDNAMELNGVLITPVDKEAISRVYTNLYWIVLSVKHLDVEITAYEIDSLAEYEPIFSNLKQQMNEMTVCLGLLKEKKFDSVIAKVYSIIHLDNLLILEYSSQLTKLFSGNDMKRILQHKEVLAQLKEISKRIHFCADCVEDIVFKMN